MYDETLMGAPPPVTTILAQGPGTVKHKFNVFQHFPISHVTTCIKTALTRSQLYDYLIRLSNWVFATLNIRVVQLYDYLIRQVQISATQVVSGTKGPLWAIFIL